MVKFLCGSNVFALSDALASLENNFILDNGSIGIEKFEAEDCSISNLADALQNTSFLSDKKMVIVKRPTNNSDVVNYLLQNIEHLPDDTELILYEPKADKRSQFYKLCKKLGFVEEYGELGESDLAIWAINFAKEQGVSLSTSIAKYLVGRVGLNQQKLTQEILKLSVFNEITKEHIDSLVSSNIEQSIFDLVDSVFSGSKEKSIRLYESMRSSGTEAQYIFAMLVWQMHIVVVVASAQHDGASTQDVVSNFSLSSYVVQKTNSLINSKKIDLTKVKKMVARTLATDIQLKTTSADADVVMRQLILEL